MTDLIYFERINNFNVLEGHPRLITSISSVYTDRQAFLYTQVYALYVEFNLGLRYRYTILTYLGVVDFLTTLKTYYK